MLILNIPHTAYFYQQMIIPQRLKIKKNPTKIFSLIGPLFLFLTLLFQLWFRLEITSKGYYLEELRQKALNNDSQLRELNLEYVLLTHNKQLKEKSLAEGFVAPFSSQIREIK